jgi:hypothetical protein
MPCALTQGYSLDCKDNAGGVKNVWIANFSNVSGITAAAGVISAISKANNGRFYLYQQYRDTSDAFEDITGDAIAGTVFYAQTVNIALRKMQASIRNEIKLLAQALTVMVVQDRNDKYWYYGETNGMDLNTGKIGTGKTLAEKNGYDLTFTGAEPSPAQEVQSAVIATLTVP